MLVVFRQTTRETSSLTDPPPPMNISNGSAGKQLGPAVGVSTRRSETRSGGQRQGPAVLVFIRQASPVMMLMRSAVMVLDEIAGDGC
ncbi:hypothetical protein HanXRQr2_Chr10g0431201 [Helianthus annuus]|uniref:Uncharacterized protein n=1 Tax=Helianthus annuus TaxID=4232 RepID=A0A9K3HVS4_HELAN|nr:hypothetical protein HanXRQr2_Chr10g0431201 [Helianthus annuus]KAJ0513186.1 hypothetical protein HanHA300_Chr10g0354551 [Helianthus annuus]